MYNQLIRHSKFLLVSAAMSAAIVACKRDEVKNNVSTDTTAESRAFASHAHGKGNSPAAHIAASEKLAIPSTVELPANLPGGNTRVATFYAVGVQKYKAREKAGTDPVAYEWVFVAPQADLYDITNAKVGTHSAGPTWQLSAIDSIYAQQFSPPKTAPSADAGSIDWLLLMPKAGKAPTGVFADVSYIQRIATKGGKAPTTPPLHANETVEVKYQAVYRFTKKNP